MTNDPFDPARDRDNPARLILAHIAWIEDFEVEKISLDATVKELGMDAIDIMEYIMHVEDEFDVRIDDEAVKSREWTLRGFCEHLGEIVKAESPMYRDRRA